MSSPSNQNTTQRFQGLRLALSNGPTYYVLCEISSPWWWRYYAPLKRRSASTRLYSAMSQHVLSTKEGKRSSFCNVICTPVTEASVLGHFNWYRNSLFITLSQKLSTRPYSFMTVIYSKFVKLPECSSYIYCVIPAWHENKIELVTFKIACRNKS
jgi:hypothetical protein